MWLKELTVASIVTFDTGSTDLLIPSSVCRASDGCIGNGAKFNSERSNTFSNTNKPWIVRFATGVGVGVGSAATPFCSGTTAADTVSIAGLSVQKQTFALIKRQSPNLFESTGIEGIIGMGFSSTSAIRSAPFFQNLINQKKIKQPVFSLLMTPKSVGGAQLTLGGTDPSKYSGSINYLPVPQGPSWRVRFDSISVNGKASGIRSQIAVADTGTSNMIAPAKDARAIYALISPNIKMIDPRGAYGLPCSQVKGLNATITFTMGGRKYTIPSKELSVGPYPGKPGTCQMLINSGSAPFWIIGGSLMKYYYLVFDVGGRRLGWATAKHSPTVQ
jgi:hypothetical protein